MVAGDRVRCLIAVCLNTSLQQILWRRNDASAFRQKSSCTLNVNCSVINNYLFFKVIQNYTVHKILTQ